MTTSYFKKHFLIEPLSWKNVSDAIKVANASLPHHASKTRGPESAYRLHLKDPDYAGYAAVRNIRYCEYFVLISKETSDAVGVAGFYVKYGKSEEGIAWLDWFGITPNYQGQGIGSKLFQWIERHVTDLGFETAKLFTSSRTSEAHAQVIYGAEGYFLVRTYTKRDYPYKVFLRKKQLKNPA